MLIRSIRKILTILFFVVTTPLIGQAIQTELDLDIATYLNKINEDNYSNGTISFTHEIIQTKSGEDDIGGKDCDFPSTTSNSKAAMKFKNLLSSFEGYQMAQDPEFNKGDSDLNTENYSISSISLITENSSKILSGFIGCESFTGGAHGLNQDLTFIIRCDTGLKIEPKDLIDNSNFDELLSLAYKSYLISNYCNVDYTSREDDIDQRKNDLFSFDKIDDNDPIIVEMFNHLFVSKDYLFVYIPVYAFGCYADGDCLIPIPLNKLSNVLSPIGKKLLLDS
jgi:hypothetical protein